MIKKISPGEAYRKLSKLPGFEADEDGMGHKIDSLRCRVWIRNARAGDEVFESESFGSLNISEMYRRFAGQEGRPWELAIADAVNNTARSEINTTYAKSIPKARLQEPIIIAFASDGWHVIDGSHRIHRLAALRKKSVFAWPATPALLRVARIRKFVMGLDGTWRDDDTVAQARFEHEMRGAEQFLNRMQATMASRQNGR
ncbi:hypothetical protein Brsp07_05421 [Brucella sp. NBRC 14130]|uniref:hypothetical protein n=1 Tax=Brucella sp. NBRC 14130 TaxID=3075483 RepID=UPI0030AF2B20